MPRVGVVGRRRVWVMAAHTLAGDQGGLRPDGTFTSLLSQATYVGTATQAAVEARRRSLRYEQTAGQELAACAPVADGQQLHPDGVVRGVPTSDR